MLLTVTCTVPLPAGLVAVIEVPELTVKPAALVEPNLTTGSPVVRFGSTNAAGFTVNSGTSITATSPAGSGTVHVTVSNIGGTSATSTADQFTYAAPVVTGGGG